MSIHKYLEVKRVRDKDIRWMIFLALVVFITAISSSLSVKFKIEMATWHYTLSTIIQSLAAILTMGGAFFIFKIPQIDKEVDDYRNRIIHFLSIREGIKASNYYDWDNNELGGIFSDHIKDFQADSNLVQFFNKYERINLTGNTQKKALENWLKLLNVFIDKKEDINRFLKKSVEYIGTTIIISTILLIGSNTFFNIPSYNHIILAIPVSLFVVSTYYVSTAILKLTK